MTHDREYYLHRARNALKTAINNCNLAHAAPRIPSQSREFDRLIEALVQIDGLINRLRLDVITLSAYITKDGSDAANHHPNNGT